MKLESVVKQPVNNGLFIVFSSKGSSYFTKTAAHEIGLKHESNFDLVQDKQNLDDYYLKVVEAGAGLKVKCYPGNRNMFQFHARSIARKLGQQFHVAHDYVKIQLGACIKVDNEVFYPLITASIKLLNK